VFKEKNRIPNEDDIDQEKPPLLVGDETNKDMPYTQEATIKTHYKKLRKFIKLIDYLIIDGKLKMILNSTESLKNQIYRMNEAAL
jgi:dynein heavy chain